MSRVIVTNDDGINAAGLRELVKALAHIADVYVFAPEKQNSGKSQAMSYKEGFSVTERKVQGAIRAFEITGTPTDCVKYGVKYMKAANLKVDYVISGINHGGNTGNMLTYSGTCGAAREGAYAGIHSIALSVLSAEAKEFAYITGILKDLMELSRELSTDVFLNVNAPNIPAWEVKGVKLLEAAPTYFGVGYEPVADGKGRYKYTVAHREYDQNAENDYAQLRKGYVTVTPVTTDVNDRDALRQLSRMTFDKAFCVLVDLQEKLVPAMRKSDRLMTNASKLLRSLNRLDVPVIATEQYSRGLGRTVPELMEAAGEKTSYIDKLSFDAFDTPEFEEAMKNVKGGHVILLGAESHICVLMTAQSFLDRGFEVYIAKDCCASRTKEAHETAMAELRARGAHVLPWESIVYKLLGDSKNPAFRTISSIVKED